MTTATLLPKPEVPVLIAEALVPILPGLRPGQSVLISGVRWEEYEALLEARERNGLNLEVAYSRAHLEVMTHGNLHGRLKSLLGRIVSALCEELHVPMILGRNCTIRRDDLDRGFEPDDWFYIGPTATRMTEPTATRPLDFLTDPPPDPAIEVEISRRLLDRVDLYTAL